ncbi:TrpB-like pyridoxal phosphate-dependent enzyme [Streptomyces alfalfae]|nr:MULTISPECIES: TrpB-like pyridoxal phosphate-dependent enzyme [Streptomyces]AYA15076.1 TrpB-like pyridoxal phosphate-dependent enzyme [Streptomyces fradiae]APY84765.1 TrpB-like pyridoxal-phosphate dependent enzyme [Streptomyces alfalfae]KUL52928.1 tryptophan synthase subunit beta [Streptomyces sp. NRRL S-1521]QUI35422.1 TrpB-like pyridoxal phosphate-dependent enzyme [Streptomyces alfalfae]RXX47198.1 TrpB-like pyridoxal phosphate-dependent enzyme [Streptomyces alfalfae]
MPNTKFLLAEDRIPTTWYNVIPDLPGGLPPMLHPGTKEPITEADLEPLFPAELIAQEFSTDREVDIPGAVIDIYRQWRPAPLIRARRLEQALDTPARIYFKYEGVSPAGSHKPNTAVPQAYYNKRAGVERLITETGAGQWGSSLALACSYFGLACEVYMVKVSYQQKPYRRGLMETFGASVTASPSELTAAGRAALAADPDSTGSLGLAISEAVEVAAASGGSAKYALGSVLNHVLMHQTIIGQEALLQMELADDYPDIVIGAAGGGSNFGGLALPFLREQLGGGRSVRAIAVEPSSCPTMTKGGYEYDFGDTAGLTPLTKMHTLGHDFVPPGIHAGGLRYHGMAPIISALKEADLLEARAVPQTACFEAGVTFARNEGIVPAPESTHAVRAAIDEALKAKEEGAERSILFTLSGHGHFDMQAYIDYFAGKLQD